ncbi:MAG: LytTR family DNA-binding domain-containing protein [Nonlabens sp.]
MKALIIDDEPKAREVLQILLEDHCPEVTEIFKAPNLLDGVALIKNERPQLVFLDIEMPQHSGLEIADFIDKEHFDFDIIFTTAYSDYAVQAFKLNAIDYLLKPLRPEKLKTALKRAIEFRGKTRLSERLMELKNSFKEANFSKIALPYSDGIKFVEFDRIIAVKADGMYTEFHLLGNEKILVSKPLKHFTDILENVKMFYKPHRSYLINLKHIKEYVRKDGGYILMEGDLDVLISRDKREEFLSIVQSI